MVVSKVNTQTKSQKMYLKIYEGTASVWTSDRNKAKEFQSREAAKKLAELHKGEVEQ